MYIEFVIKQSKVKLVEWCRQSKFGATSLYAIMNSVIIFCLFKLKIKRFWFISVDNQIDENENLEENGKCVHGKVKCEEYLKKEIMQTGLFSLGVALFKLVFPRLTKLIKNPKLIFPTFLRKFEYGLFAYLFTSNGIFKYLFCRLNREGRFSKEINCFLSALVSSLPYLFYPRYIIFTMTLTTMIEVKKTNKINL